MKFYQRTSFWTKVAVFFNIAMTTIQGALTESDSAHVWKWIFISAQILGNGLMLFTEDKNKNDRPDVFEDEVVVTSTTTTVIKKDEPVKSDTETTIETKKD